MLQLDRVSQEPRLAGIARTVVRRTDSQINHAATPVRLIRDLRDHHLRCAGQSSCRRRARAAMVHDGGHSAE